MTDYAKYEQQAEYKGVKYTKYVEKFLPHGQLKMCYIIGIESDLTVDLMPYTRVYNKGYLDDILILFQSLEIQLFQVIDQIEPNFEKFMLLNGFKLT
jgi:hypothetical protein